MVMDLSVVRSFVRSFVRLGSTFRGGVTPHVRWAACLDVMTSHIFTYRYCNSIIQLQYLRYSTSTVRQPPRFPDRRGHVPSVRTRSCLHAKSRSAGSALLENLLQLTSNPTKTAQKIRKSKPFRFAPSLSSLSILPPTQQGTSVVVAGGLLACLLACCWACLRPHLLSSLIDAHLLPTATPP